MVSINVLALIIVGGMGSIPGVIAGASRSKDCRRSYASCKITAFWPLGRCWWS